jgi:hypothetical protein
MPTFRRNKFPPASRSIKLMYNKRNCASYNTALTKAVSELANCVEGTEKGAGPIRNRFTLTLTDKKWPYFLTQAGLVKPLDLWNLISALLPLYQGSVCWFTTVYTERYTNSVSVTANEKARGIWGGEQSFLRYLHPSSSLLSVNFSYNSAFLPNAYLCLKWNVIPLSLQMTELPTQRLQLCK